MKYVVVSGGVVSGLGKGISISSLGVLLKASGLRVTAVKVDPYLNYDAGTMSPFEHGECYVVGDGGETDLDCGAYERFLDINLNANNNLTTGKIYGQVLAAERKGEYLGKTVQVIPHVTNAIMDWIEDVAHTPVDGQAGAPDVCLVELGGTVGDIESLVYLEALRQFRGRVGQENMIFVHVSLVPVVGAVGEQKTKPTQHSVKELRSVGINPDMLICRSTSPLEADVRSKLALFTQVPVNAVLAVHDVPNLYHVPLILAQQGAHDVVIKHLGLASRVKPMDIKPWAQLAATVDELRTDEPIVVALVGKYTGLSDSYLSVIKALKHASMAVRRRVEIAWIDATGLEAPEETSPEHAACWRELRAAHAVLIPGGFGTRGVAGKLAAAHYARTHKVPMLGICLGMQVAVIEFCREVLGMPRAHSTEFSPDTPEPVIVNMPEHSTTHLGGTMRLGARTTILRPRHDEQTTWLQDLYGPVPAVLERHRHRYEVNPELLPRLVEAGMFITGTDERGVRAVAVELSREAHPYYVGVQYHPELISRPLAPSPLFVGLVRAAAGTLADSVPLLEGAQSIAVRTATHIRPALASTPIAPSSDSVRLRADVALSTTSRTEAPLDLHPVAPQSHLIGRAPSPGLASTEALHHGE